MRVIIGLTLLRARGRIIALSLGFAVFIMLVGLSYASVDQNAIRTLIEQLPPALRALAGASDLASPAGYLGAAFLHPVPLTILGVLVISITSSVTRDRESGAADLLLSRPLPPHRWLAGQTIALAIALGIVGTAGMLGGILARSVVADLESVSTRGVAAAGLGAMLLFAAIAGVSLFIAVIVPRGAQAVGWASGFVVASYALNYLAQVWTPVDVVAPLSVFHHFEPGGIVAAGALPWSSALTLLGVAVGGVAAAHVAIDRREIGGT